MLIIVALLSVTGVWGVWSYAQGSVQELEQSNHVYTFTWTGVEQLPNEVVGQQHVELVTNILDGTMTDSEGNEVGIGLNDPDSELNQQIASRKQGGLFKPARDNFGSMDAWDTAQMHSLFGLEASELSFMMYFPEETPDIMYLYTTGVDLGEQGFRSSQPNIPYGEKVYPIYETTLYYEAVAVDENGEDIYEWVAKRSRTGSCVSAPYENDYAGSAIIETPAFDASEFYPFHEDECDEGEVADPLGTTKDNPIYTYVGATVIELIDTDTELSYYRFTAKSANDITVSVLEGCPIISITIYSDSDYSSAVAASKNGVLTFTPTVDAVYYLAATGNKSLNFEIVSATSTT